MTDYLLLENDDYLLQENGDKIILDQSFYTYNLSITDAFTTADVGSDTMAAGVSVTDGIASGDSVGETSAMGVSISDDITLEDISAIVYYLTLTDGLTINDVRYPYNMLKRSLRIGLHRSLR